MARLHCSLPIHFFLKFTFPVSILYGKNMVWYHITSPCPGQNWHCCLGALFIFSLPPSHLITSMEFLQFKPLKHHHLHNCPYPWKLWGSLCSTFGMHFWSFSKGGEGDNFRPNKFCCRFVCIENWEILVMNSQKKLFYGITPTPSSPPLDCNYNFGGVLKI